MSSHPEVILITPHFVNAANAFEAWLKTRQDTYWYHQGPYDAWISFAHDVGWCARQRIMFTNDELLGDWLKLYDTILICTLDEWTTT